MSPRHLALLAQLREHPQTSAALAGLLCISPDEAGTICAALRHQGLVVELATRPPEWRITDAGRAALAVRRAG